MIVNENRDENWELAYAGTIKIYFTPKSFVELGNIYLYAYYYQQLK